MATKHKSKLAPKSTKAEDAEIATLARGAARRGDTKLLKLAGRALAGNAAARRECTTLMGVAKALARGEDEGRA